MNIDEYISKFIKQDIYILTDKDVKGLIKLIESLVEREIKKTRPTGFEDHNFRVDSTGWEKEGEYLVNKTKDIWELTDEGYEGEQLFTWSEAMRETKKAKKRMPTDKEFTKLLKTKKDMPNLVYAGYGYGGSWDLLGSAGHFWSSSQNVVSAWYRYLNLSGAQVYRYAGGKANGFSVRCLKN